MSVQELLEGQSIFPLVITFPLGHVMILFGEKYVSHS